MTRHPLLARQLKRAQLDDAALSPPYDTLFAAIDAAYHQFDTEHAQLERTLDLNAVEQQQVHSEMRAVYERLIASSLDGVFAFDLDARFTVWNPVMERLTNMYRPQVLYTSMFEVFPQLQTAQMAQTLAEVLKGKPIFMEEVGYDDAQSGQKRFFDIQYTPLLNEGGEIIGGLGMMHDITQRKAAQEAQHRQYAYLDAIQEMALRLNGASELTELLTAIMQRVGVLLVTDDVFLTMRDAAGSQPTLHYGLGRFQAAGASMVALAAHIAEVQHTAMPLLSSIMPLYDQQAAHWVIVPVFHGIQVSGVLGVVRAPGDADFAPGEIAVVRQLAQLAAIALQQDALNAANARLAALATTDPLTTLPNHRDILDHVEATLAQCRQRGEPCAILFVDIDHFKIINDTWGHRAGDAVLQEVGQRLARTIRHDDVVGRYGGEEFLVLLRDVRPDEAARIAEDLRLSLFAHPYHWHDTNGTQTAIDITASIGIALYPQQGLTRDKLIEVADGAMYSAKRAGRNRVCIANSSAAQAA